MTDRTDSLPPAVILSGGRSSRMGEAKALLAFGPARLVDHVAARIAPQVSDLFINANDPSIRLTGIDAFADGISGFRGPLAGIHAALAHIRDARPGASHVFVLPVDCPFFPRDIVRRLSEAILVMVGEADENVKGHMSGILGEALNVLAAEHTLRAEKVLEERRKRKEAAKEKA